MGRCMQLSKFCLYEEKNGPETTRIFWEIQRQELFYQLNLDIYSMTRGLIKFVSLKKLLQ